MNIISLYTKNMFKVYVSYTFFQFLKISWNPHSRVNLKQKNSLAVGLLRVSPLVTNVLHNDIVNNDEKNNNNVGYNLNAWYSYW